MYCKNCGKMVDDTASYCDNCGTRIDKNFMTNVSEDSSSVWFAVLGFFVPIVGLILFLIYEDKKPKRAKMAGKGALVGFIINILISTALVILNVTFASSMLFNLLSRVLYE